MVARKGDKEQRLRKKLRTQWDAIFERLTTDVMQLQTKWEEAMKRKVEDLGVTSDGKIFSPGWDNLGRLITGILRGLYVLKAADGTCSREHLSSVYSEPQLSRKLEVLRRLNEIFIANMERMRNPKFLCCCYRIGCAAWESRCLKGGGGVAEKPYLANMQTRVRRALTYSVLGAALGGSLPRRATTPNAPTAGLRIHPPAAQRMKPTRKAAMAHKRSPERASVGMAEMRCIEDEYRATACSEWRIVYFVSSADSHFRVRRAVDGP